MRAPDGVGKMIDVPGFKTGTVGIEFDCVCQPDIAHHLAELRLGNQWILTRHRAHVDVEMTDLWCENWPVRTPAPYAANLHLRNDGASGRAIDVALLILGSPLFNGLNSRRGRNNHVRTRSQRRPF